jgi:hypothetical protein
MLGSAPERGAAGTAARCGDIIDVYEAGVRLEVTLPWLLAQFARAVQRVVGNRAVGLLEKK